jgi:hypothetical protein
MAGNIFAISDNILAQAEEISRTRGFGPKPSLRELARDFQETQQLDQRIAAAQAAREAWEHRQHTLIVQFYRGDKS